MLAFSCGICSPKNSEKAPHGSPVKVRLHGTRQAARLARDMVQRDLLRGNSIYMEGSSRARLLHIIHVSAFLGLFWGRCSSKKTEATARDSMCRAAIISSNLYCRPGSQQSRVCCVSPCKRSCCIPMFLYLRRGCRAAVALPVASRVNAALGPVMGCLLWIYSRIRAWFSFLCVMQIPCIFDREIVWAYSIYINETRLSILVIWCC